MSEQNDLNVWHEQRLVGKIWQEKTGKIGFEYDSTWLENGFDISQQLPLSIKKYLPEEGIAHAFFANLLPEANVRTNITRDLKISDSDFALLKAIGGECAGALNILPNNLKPRKKPLYKKLTENELQKIILRRGLISSFVPEKNRPRLSLAGAQGKCPIYFDGTHYLLPENEAPSSHLLKFEIPNYKNVPVYEAFLTLLAKHIHLPTVDITFCTKGNHHYLLIKRYDRIVEDLKNIKRIHQEDFCQALGYGHSRKYQKEGGPSFKECYQLIQNISSNPIQDCENLLQWLIFNVLTGNSDAHAKNISILYDEHHTIKLAPFYDLVCTRAIARIDSNLAMSIGDEFNPDKVTQKHWGQLAEACQINKNYLHKLIQNTAENLKTHFDTCLELFESSAGTYPALQRVKKVFLKQYRQNVPLRN